MRLGEQHKLAALQTVLYRHYFNLESEEIAHFTRHNELRAIARQLAQDRKTLGAEVVDGALAAARITGSAKGGNFISQRKRQAQNFWACAAWLDGWGAPAVRQAQAVRNHARRMWPFGAGETGDLQG